MHTASGNVYLWTGAAYGEFHGATGDPAYEGPIGCRRLLVRTATGWDLVDRQGFCWRFAADGRISEKRDRFGNRVEVLGSDAADLLGMLAGLSPAGIIFALSSLIVIIGTLTRFGRG